MDPKIVSIMQNFSSEVDLFKRKDPNSLFLELFRKNGVDNPVSFVTKDGSTCYGAKQQKSVDGFYIVEYDNKTYYIGQLLNGLRNGYGYRSYLQSELIYEGEYRENEKSGKGKLFSPSRKLWVFDGLWSKDKKNGHGEMWKEKAAYSGYWKDDFMDGIGQMRWPDKQTYEGEFMKDFRHGRGVMYYPNGDIYIGDFREGKLHGQGTYKWTNGEVYEGKFLNGLMDGDGTVKYQLPIYGTGSVRNGSTNDLAFDLKDYNEWENGIQKSYVGISSFRNTVIPSTEEIDDKQFTMSIRNMPEIRNFNPQQSIINMSSIKSFVPVRIPTERNEFTRNENINYNNTQSERGFIGTVGDYASTGANKVVSGAQYTGNAIASGVSNLNPWSDKHEIPAKSMADQYREQVGGKAEESNNFRSNFDSDKRINLIDGSDRYARVENKFEADGLKLRNESDGYTGRVRDGAEYVNNQGQIVSNTGNGVVQTIGQYTSEGANKVVSGTQKTGEAISSVVNSGNPFGQRQIVA